MCPGSETLRERYSPGLGLTKEVMEHIWWLKPRSQPHSTLDCRTCQSVCKTDDENRLSFRDLLWQQSRQECGAWQTQEGTPQSPGVLPHFEVLWLGQGQPQHSREAYWAGLCVCVDWSRGLEKGKDRDNFLDSGLSSWDLLSEIRSLFLEL